MCFSPLGARRQALFVFRCFLFPFQFLICAGKVLGKERRAKGEKRLSCYNLPVMISPDLLEILVCPVCRKPLVLRGEESLKCNECKRSYPIRDGIPILLEHEATIESF